MLYFCTNDLPTLFQNTALDLSWNVSYSIFMLLFLISVQVLYLVALSHFTEGTKSDPWYCLVFLSTEQRSCKHLLKVSPFLWKKKKGFSQLQDAEETVII